MPLQPSKISGLPVATSADTDDLLPIVDVSAGATKRITKTALLTPAQKTITFADDPYTVLNTDNIILGDTSGGDTNVILPLATSFTNGIVVIKKIDNSGNRIQVAITGGDLLDSSGGINLNLQNNCIQIISDGVSNWWITAKTF